MNPPLSDTWDNMPDHERWALLHKTDLRGLQKCQIALQPWARIKSSYRERISEAWTVRKGE